MTALDKTHPREGLWMTAAPVPESGPDDALIKVTKNRICGTDIHIWDWDDWAQHTVPVPLITGHEFAGEIVEIGRNVEGLTIGQRCSGEGRLIGSARRARASPSRLGTRGIGVNVQVAFAQYLRLPAFNVVPLPDEIGAIFHPLVNAVHTALSFDLLGEDVLITGSDLIGIMAAAARHAGAWNVAITYINPDRLTLASHVVPTAHPVNVAQKDLNDMIPELGLQQGSMLAWKCPAVKPPSTR